MVDYNNDVHCVPNTHAHTHTHAHTYMHTHTHAHTHIHAHAHTHTHTEHRDHFEVRKYLKDLETEQLLQLGLALGLQYPTLKDMKNMPDDLIHSWLLRQQEVIKQSGEPTYKSLATALDEIEQTGLAQDVRQQKCTKLKKF